ncbi:substrate-binding domain-containing protein [Mesobacillus maritimus]|uniref:substrate-binding domain-containing protein n=1 Tax=Mesobacillus maritimus TaxID=1643336 RepID=UPI003850B2AC
MTLKKKVYLLLGIVALVFSLVACSSGSSESSSGEPGGEAKEGELTKVGMTVMTLNNPYFVRFKEALEEQAEKHGFEAIVQGADLDLAKQQAQVETFIQQGVDVIFLNAVDSRGVAAAVQQAKAANIPVIAVDVGADGEVNATITSDNFEAGKLAGEYVVEKLNGEGNVVLVNGTPITAIFDRIDGFKAALEGTDVKIITDQNGELDRDKSFSVMENILSSHSKGEIDAVFGVNDPTTIGAYLAAQSAGRDDFFFVSVDGSEEAVNFIKESDQFAQTSQQFPGKEIEKAVEIAKQILKGEEVEEEILVPVSSISDETVDTFVPEF